MGTHQLRHLVVGKPGEIGRGRRRPCLLDWRHREHEDLRVVGKAVHRAKSRVEVGQGSVEVEDAFAVVAKLSVRKRAFEVWFEALQVTLRKDVRERIDLLHARSALRTSPSDRRRRAWPSSWRRSYSLCLTSGIVRL
jgi:hypothetical protein